MYDNVQVSDDINIINTKLSWLEKKSIFKSFLINDLKITDKDVVDRMLEEFNEGLNANIDFRMLMFALGYDEGFVDAVVDKYNAGEKPRYSKYNGFYNENSEVSKEVIKEMSKKRFMYRRKPYDPSKLEELRKNAEELLSDIKTSYENIEIEQSYPNSIFDEMVMISNEANLYPSIMDLASDTKGEIPYYEGSIERYIVGVACISGGDYIMTEDKFALDSILNNGGEIIGVLTSIDGVTEGFYKISDVIKRGVTR